MWSEIQGPLVWMLPSDLALLPVGPIPLALDRPIQCCHVDFPLLRDLFCPDCPVCCLGLFVHLFPEVCCALFLLIPLRCDVVVALVCSLLNYCLLLLLLVAVVFL